MTASPLLVFLYDGTRRADTLVLKAVWDGYGEWAFHYVHELNAALLDSCQRERGAEAATAGDGEEAVEERRTTYR